MKHLETQLLSCDVFPGKAQTLLLRTSSSSRKFPTMTAFRRFVSEAVTSMGNFSQDILRSSTGVCRCERHPTLAGPAKVQDGPDTFPRHPLQIDILLCSSPIPLLLILVTLRSACSSQPQQQSLGSPSSFPSGSHSAFSMTFASFTPSCQSIAYIHCHQQVVADISLHQQEPGTLFRSPAVLHILSRGSRQFGRLEVVPDADVPPMAFSTLSFSKHVYFS